MRTLFVWQSNNSELQLQLSLALALRRHGHEVLFALPVNCASQISNFDFSIFELKPKKKFNLIRFFSDYFSLKNNIELQKPDLLISNIESISASFACFKSKQIFVTLNLNAIIFFHKYFSTFFSFDRLSKYFISEYWVLCCSPWELFTEKNITNISAVRPKHLHLSGSFLTSFGPPLDSTIINNLQAFQKNKFTRILIQIDNFKTIQLKQLISLLNRLNSNNIIAIHASTKLIPAVKQLFFGKNILTFENSNLQLTLEHFDLCLHQNNFICSDYCAKVAIKEISCRFLFGKMRNSEAINKLLDKPLFTEESAKRKELALQLRQYKSEACAVHLCETLAEEKKCVTREGFAPIVAQLKLSQWI